MDNMGGGFTGPPRSSQSSSEMVDDAATGFSVEDRDQLAEEAEPCAHRLGRASFLCDLRHDADQTSIVAVPEPGVVSRWRMKDRVSVINLPSSKCFTATLVSCQLYLNWDALCSHVEVASDILSRIFFESCACGWMINHETEIRG